LCSDESAPGASRVKFKDTGYVNVAKNEKKASRIDSRESNGWPPLFADFSARVGPF
jgi:hypothetical protein